MSPDSRLEDAYVKLERSREHIAELSKSIAAYKPKMGRINTRRDPEGRLEYYIEGYEPPPKRLASVAGDAINNLRGALDHLAYQLYLVGTNKRSGGGHVHFPSGEGSMDFQSRLRVCTVGMRKDAIEAISNLQPFKGGTGERLWLLARLSNTDKHKYLIKVNARLDGLDVLAYMRTRIQRQEETMAWKDFKMPKFILSPSGDQVLEDGQTLFVARRDDIPDPNIKFLFKPVLSVPGILNPTPVAELMEELVRLVAKTLDDFRPLL